MKISTKGRYGLSVMLYLAENYPTIVSSIFISKQLDISKLYLDQIFSLLKVSNLVRVDKGPNGGYTISKPSNQITVYDILKCTQPHLLSKTDSTVGPKSITHIDITIQENIFNNLDSLIFNFLNGITLDELVKLKTEKNDMNDMFYI
ncbi:MAG: Rrf2 family transcriptional regulator [Christensenellaceae bacterium]|jgi:Rrf2 family protein|nr:Rrf2 family transcriptional regulator [Christensenellaceae bacterium]